MSEKTERRGDELSREDLFVLYSHALEEYRFQVRLNWDRSRYFFILNLAVLGIAVGLERTTFDLVAGGVFAAGTLLAVLSLLNIRTQRDYYRASRDTVRKIQDRLNLADLALRPTPGFGAQHWRIASVNSVLYLMLGIILLLDLLGFMTLLAQGLASLLSAGS